MTDPADNVGPFNESLGGGVELEYEPLPGGRIRLTARYNGEPLHSTEAKSKIFGDRTLKGQFINEVKSSLDGISGVDAADIQRELRSWFAMMNELGKEEEEEKLLTDTVRRIISGTESVEVYGAETTTVHVELTWNGETRELVFTAGEMVSGGAGALRQKMATKFFEFDLEIETEDWEAIRERWDEQKEIVSVQEETGDDAIANRVVEYLSHNLTLVGEQEKLGNSPEAAWFDEGNEAGTQVAPADETVVWIHDSFLVDQLEAAGQPVKSKNQVLKTLNKLNALWGIERDGRKRWPNPQGKDRSKFYAFKPDALGVTGEHLDYDPDEGGVEP